LISLRSCIQARRAPYLRSQAAGAARPHTSTRMETPMKLSPITLMAAVAVSALGFAAVAAAPTFAQQKEQTVTVGGSPMYPSKNIIQNAVNSKDHTTLVAAVKAAGLVVRMQGPRPFHSLPPPNPPHPHPPSPPHTTPP